MSETVVQAADLSYIFRAISELNGGIEHIDGKIGRVGNDLLQTRSELAKLQADFNDFVAADAKAKQLQLAETRLVKVRQELETKYGYYAIVRRHATGILQAADVSLVRQETIASATEELMLGAPGYWLAPGLVAMAAWLRDDRALAEKAAREACRRDDEKTSLFFALIGRRARRLDVCRRWLDRYFSMQDPRQLDRQGVVLVDALANGIFGSEVRQTCSQRLAEWVRELSEASNFIAEQRRQWHDGLLSKVPATDNSPHYRYLKTYSPSWPALNQSLNSVTGFAVIRDHFQQIFTGPVPVSPSLEAAVDELLNSLVTNFDDEELPLRRQERLLQLIVDEDGDKHAAQARMGLEKQALEETVSFTQLLTNAAMHPEVSHASLATQRLAIAVSRVWIKDGFSDLVAAIRNAVPRQIDLRIDDWGGTTTQGENEAELLAGLETHLEARKQAELSKYNFSTGHWIGVGVAVALTLAGLIPGLILFSLIGLGLGGWLAFFYYNMKPSRDRIEAHYADLKQKSADILRACLAELVEYRRAHAEQDSAAQTVTLFLERLSSGQQIQNTHDMARQVM